MSASSESAPELLVTQASPLKSSSSPTRKSNNKREKIAGKHYEIKKMLGQSYICRVHLAVDNRDQRTYALKCYPKKLVKSEQKLDSLRREVHILQKARHRYIQGLREVISGESHFYIVVEFVSSILSDKIFDSPNGRGLPQDLARKYFQKILVALRYCHLQGIVHRDMKTDKILIDDETADIKITGFDISEFQKPGELLPTCFTNFANSAPEILAGDEYDGFQADVFSVVSSVLFPMLFGVHPFENQKKTLMFNNIENCEFSFPSWSSNDDDEYAEAKDLIEKVLVEDPDERLTIDQILKHPWFLKGFDESELEWGRSSAGIKRAESEVGDTTELDKLNFSADESNNKNNDDNDDDDATKKTSINNKNKSLKTSTGDDHLDSLLKKFPPNFIFEASDIEIFGNPIGAGGSGSVFKAKIKSVGWDVAAKLFREKENIERAIRECEMSLKLRHKNIVQTVGLAVARSSFSTDLVMLMELGESSLDSVLFSCQQQQQQQQQKQSSDPASSLLPFDVVWSYSKQIAEALAFLHSQKDPIIHLDTKPSNILLMPSVGNQKMVKLCDLGISRVCKVNNNDNSCNDDDGDHASTTTVDGFQNQSQEKQQQKSPEEFSVDVTRSGIGTLRYCSLEQLLSKKLTLAADVFSLGATIFSMIDETFEPWHNCTVAEITQRKVTLTEILKPRSGCPQKLIDICRKCIEPDLKDRPKDCIEVFKMFLEPGEEESSSFPAFLRNHPSCRRRASDTTGMLASQTQPVSTSLDQLLFAHHHHHSNNSNNNNNNNNNNTGHSYSSTMGTFTLTTSASSASGGGGSSPSSGQQTEVINAIQDWTM